MNERIFALGVERLCSCSHQHNAACVSPLRRLVDSEVHVPHMHMQAMYKMPTKKDKTALEAIEAALEREKAEAKAAAARHKLTVERLRCRVKTLEVRVG